MSSFSWYSVLQKAWQSPQKNLTFYWWALPSAFIGFLATSQLESLDFKKPSLLFFSTLAVLFFFYLTQAFLKMGLLFEISGEENQEKIPKKRYSLKKLLVLLQQTLRIEFFILGLSLLFVSIISLPLLIAFLYNTSALKILSLIVFGTTVPLVLLLILFRELLYLYTNLASLTVTRIALEATLTLLTKKTALLFQLLVLSFASLFLFTILLNVVMLTSAPFWEKYFSFSLGDFTQHLFMVFFQAWFLIFWQAVWYYGFQMIAKLPEPKIETLPESDELPVVTSL